MVKKQEIRSLYVHEREDIDNIIKTPQNAVQGFLDHAFTLTPDEVKVYKKGEFLKLLYAGNSPARRYFARKEILGWDIFEVLDNAKKEGYVTYNNYLEYIKKTINPEILNRLVLVIAHSLISYKEVLELKSEGTWSTWVQDVAIFYTNSFITTVWEGKQKEEVLKPIVRKELEKYQGLRLAKTSVEKDMAYMIDFVVLDEDNKPLFAISCKGVSWWWASHRKTNKATKAKADSVGKVYYTKGEVREHAGHEKFTMTYGAPVIVVVSETTTQKALLWVVPAVRDALKQFESEGKIFKNVSNKV